MSKKIKREQAVHRKLGDDRNEPAIKHRKVAKNFSQSRDVHEDRGQIQKKLGKKK